MSLTVVTYGRMYARVLAGLNALKRGTYDAGAAAEIDERDRRRDPHAIRDLIVAKDAAVIAACCMRADGPYRARFTDFSAELAYASGLPPELPERYGPLGAVYIQRWAGDVWVEGKEARSVDQIRQWRENVDHIFGAIAHDQANSPLGGFFLQVGARIPFTGYRLKAEVATFDVDHEGNPPALGTPECFEDVLYAGVIADSPIEGDYSKQEFRSYYERMMPVIASGAEAVAPLEQK